LPKYRYIHYNSIGLNRILFPFSYIQFGEGGSSCTSNLPAHQVPPALQEKVILLRYFAQYMDENLTEGGDSSGRGHRTAAATNSSSRTPNGPPPGIIPQIKRWIRTSKAIIMHLTNGTIQVQCITRKQCLGSGSRVLMAKNCI
jgi:hypothetical protein